MIQRKILPTENTLSERKEFLSCLFLFVCLFCSVTFLDQKVGRGEVLVFTRRLAWDTQVTSHPALQCYLD